MIVGVPAESYADESRVALVPAVVPDLVEMGLEVVVQTGAGWKAGFPDPAYQEQGARLEADRSALFSTADTLLFLHTPTANPADLELLRPGQTMLGLLDPLGDPQSVPTLAGKGVTAFSLELLPRISRAQPMDALTSMATISGYKAVLVAAAELDKMCPMMMTAAGTVTPARLFVIGAGVAGLQAIATGRRLGAVVQAYDVRPAVREQVESLGARFLEMELQAGESETSGGYAKSMGEEFYRRQREMMTRAVAESDVVITTAAIPGKKSPVLLTEQMVKEMRPGSVIVDLAAEGGGNCELTKAGETVSVSGVTIMGPVNLASTVPHHASQMYARNVTAFLQNLTKDARLDVDSEDEIIRETLLLREGELVHARICEILGLNAASPPETERSNS